MEKAPRAVWPQAPIRAHGGERGIRRVARQPAHAAGAKAPLRATLGNASRSLSSAPSRGFESLCPAWKKRLGPCGPRRRYGLMAEREGFGGLPGNPRTLRGPRPPCALRWETLRVPSAPRPHEGSNPSAPHGKGASGHVAPGADTSSWRRERDSNPRDAHAPNGFQDRRIQPLCHLSVTHNDTVTEGRTRRASQKEREP